MTLTEDPLCIVRKRYLLLSLSAIPTRFLYWYKIVSETIANGDPLDMIAVPSFSIKTSKVAQPFLDYMGNYNSKLDCMTFIKFKCTYILLRFRYKTML